MLDLRIDLGNDVLLLFSDQIDELKALLPSQLHLLQSAIHLEPLVIPVVLSLSYRVFNEFVIA